MSHGSESRLTPCASALIESARVARLATVDQTGQPHVIPICFVFDGVSFYSPIDEKPKRTTQLKRIKNIAGNPKVAIVIDRYDDDWTKLAYVLVFGKARALLRGKKHGQAVALLRAKYDQYRKMPIEQRPVIAIRAERIVSWKGLKQTDPTMSAKDRQAPQRRRRSHSAI